MSNGLEGDLNQDGIIDEMDRVRGNLGGGLNQLGEQMRDVFNWQAYVRSAPLTSAAAGLVLGYLLAPRLISRSAAVASESTGSDGFRPASTNSSASSLGGMLKHMVLGGLMQAGSVYIAEVLTRDFSGRTSPAPDTDSSSEESFDSYFDLGDES